MGNIVGQCFGQSEKHPSFALLKVKFVKVKVIEQDLRSEQEIEMKKERIAIRVKTLPNGYTVDLEKENFMYYSPMALLEGLFVHVGMNREGAMTKEEIKTLIEAVKDGGAVTKLQEEVNQLKDTIAELRKQVREQKKVIRELSKGV